MQAQPSRKLPAVLSAVAGLPLSVLLQDCDRFNARGDGKVHAPVTPALPPLKRLQLHLV